MTAFEPPVDPQVDDAALPAPTDGSPAGEHGPAGDPSVAAAVTRLDGVRQLPLHEQPDVYQSVHADLQNALAAIDDA